MEGSKRRKGRRQAKERKKAVSEPASMLIHYTDVREGGGEIHTKTLEEFLGWVKAERAVVFNEPYFEYAVNGKIPKDEADVRLWCPFIETACMIPESMVEEFFEFRHALYVDDSKKEAYKEVLIDVISRERAFRNQRELYESLNSDSKVPPTTQQPLMYEGALEASQLLEKGSGAEGDAGHSLEKGLEGDDAVLVASQLVEKCSGGEVDVGQPLGKGSDGDHDALAAPQPVEKWPGVEGDAGQPLGKGSDGDHDALAAPQPMEKWPGVEGDAGQPLEKGSDGDQNALAAPQPLEKCPGVEGDVGQPLEKGSNGDQNALAAPQPLETGSSGVGAAAQSSERGPYADGIASDAPEPLEKGSSGEGALAQSMKDGSDDVEKRALDTQPLEKGSRVQDEGVQDSEEIDFEEWKVQLKGKKAVDFGELMFKLLNQGKEIMESVTKVKANSESLHKDVKADSELLREDLKADLESLRKDVKADSELLLKDLKADLESLRREVTSAHKSISDIAELSVRANLGLYLRELWRNSSKEISFPVTGKRLPYVPFWPLEQLVALCGGPGHKMRSTPSEAEIDILVKVMDLDKPKGIFTPPGSPLAGGSSLATSPTFTSLIIGEFTRSGELCSKNYTHPTKAESSPSSKLLYKFIQVERGLQAALHYYNVGQDFLEGAFIISPSFKYVDNWRPLVNAVLLSRTMCFPNITYLYNKNRVWLVSM